jgi:hypothetical protein
MLPVPMSVYIIPLYPTNYLICFTLQSTCAVLIHGHTVDFCILAPAELQQCHQFAIVLLLGGLGSSLG